VGKTQICKIIADALAIPFEKISVNGMKDSTLFKGSENVWVGSSPSIILQILRRTQSSNCAILIDEIDKLSESSQGLEVQHSLLSIIDYSQNSQFQDTFISQFPHDLSKVWFMFSMNNENDVNPILRDRLHIINVPNYETKEKTIIARDYVLPVEIENIGMSKGDITLTDDGFKQLIKSLGTEVESSGIRCIQRAIRSMVAKINTYRCLLLENGTTGNIKLTYEIKNFKLPIELDAKLVETLMGEAKSADESYKRLYI
jgi:ATP-dependent Lon protease